MKFAFCTCVQLGLSCIEAALKSNFQFDLLITLHDDKYKNKSGRIYLNQISFDNDIELLKINHINDDGVVKILKEREIDWLFIIGWSQIAGKGVLSAVQKGVIGAHPTLLPGGRGRAAIPWVIIKGLNQTGVTFFKMDEGVDTGKIIAQQVISVDERETATTLYEKVNDAHVELFLNALPQLESGNYSLEVQDESKATYWEGRTPLDGEIKPVMTTEEVDRLVRATTKPYPGAFYIDDKGKKVIIWEGSLRIESNNHINCSNGKYYLLKTDAL